VTRKKTIAVTGAAALAALLAATAPLTASAEPTPKPGSAFALSASGLLNVSAVPALDGSRGYQERSVADLTTPDGQLSAHALNVAVHETSARASVADLRIGLAQLPQLRDLDLGLLSASAVRAVCENGQGSATLARASLAGRPLEVTPPPNTTIPLAGLGSIVLNKQTRNADGSLTVTALHVRVNGVQDIDVASATCAKSASDSETPEEPTTSPQPTTEPGKPTDKPGDNGDQGDKGDQNGPAKAPRPKPVRGHHPVTG